MGHCNKKKNEEIRKGSPVFCSIPRTKPKFPLIVIDKSLIVEGKLEFAATVQALGN